MSTITLEEARAVLELHVRGAEYDSSDLDRAIRSAGAHFCERVPVALSSGAVNLTAYDTEVDLSSLTTLRPYHIVRAELGYAEQGEWATATSYAANDLVQGDGDPDNYLYVCATAHTSSSSNEPGADGGNPYWTRVGTTHGETLAALPYAELLAKSRRTIEAGKPAYYAIDAFPTGMVWPMPDLDYPLTLVWLTPFTTWTIGTASPADVTLNIPMPYMESVVMFGAAAYLQFADADTRIGSLQWTEFLRLINRAKGDMDPMPTIHQRAPRRIGM